MEGTAYGVGVNRASRSNKTLYSLPVHCLTAADLELENAKGIMQHFHAPENSHNRFLASLTQEERAILRHVERPALYTSCRAKQGWDASMRPATAPAQPAAVSGRGASRSSSSRTSTGLPSRQQQGAHAPAIEHAGSAHDFSSTKTQKGVPCYGMSMIIDVDVLTGQPASAHICSTQPWRVRRVRTCPVAPSSYGHGEGGKRAQHQSYSHYKYYGFAGQGAKTSWGSAASKPPPSAVRTH